MEIHFTPGNLDRPLVEERSWRKWTYNKTYTHKNSAHEKHILLFKIYLHLLRLIRKKCLQQ